MRLTPEEIAELTNHLVSVLKRKRFEVKTNRYGNILYAEKFSIRCCPAILNSREEGRHGFAYIQNITNPYSEKDLGSYYKPRTNKSSHVLFKTNNSIDKYSGTDVHIDMHNYKQVIETFVTDLNKDYARIVRKTEDIELDVNDSGTCVYKVNATTNIGWWHISADNYTLKDELVSCIKGLFDKYNVKETSPDMYGLHVNDIDELFTDYNITTCSWGISEPHHGHITLSFTRPTGANYDKICVDNNRGAGDILRVVDNWVKNHQDRMPESLVESIVKIKDTGTVFDGMTGIVESELNNKVTVMVDFNEQHKVRNDFKKENIEIVED